MSLKRRAGLNYAASAKLLLFLAFIFNGPFLRGLGATARLSLFHIPVETITSPECVTSVTLFFFYALYNIFPVKKRYCPFNFPIVRREFVFPEGNSTLLSVTAFLDGPVHLAVRIFFCDGISLIVQFLTSADADFHLAPSILVEIHVQRNDGETGLLDLSRDFVDFSAVEKQLSFPKGLHVEAVALFEG